MKRTHLTTEEKQRARSLIGQSLLFSGLNAKQFDDVISHTRIANLEEAEVLFYHRQSADEFFWVEAGKVKIAVGSPDGMEKVVDIILPGRTFAEAIMFGNHPFYPVGAAAIIPSRVWCVNAEHYADVLHQSTEACFAVMAQMSRRLHFQLSEIDRLTLHNATHRVVCYLLEHIPSTSLDVPEVNLDIPKHLIASRLSITPETLSRTFSKLGQAKLIEIKDNHIILRDLKGLKDCVDYGLN